jgi:hypothetical protein
MGRLRGVTKWEEFDVLEKVCEALAEVAAPANGSGRPYLTAYQLAIKVDRAHPDLKGHFGGQVGGVGIGQHNSLTEYLAGRLTQLAGDDFPVERASLSGDDVATMSFKATGGGEIANSLLGTEYPTSLFRLRD